MYIDLVIISDLMKGSITKAQMKEGKGAKYGPMMNILGCLNQWFWLNPITLRSETKLSQYGKWAHSWS